jgi:hypothetical protein
MTPNTISKVQMVSQVTKTSAIYKHTIHWKSIGDLKKIDCVGVFLLEEDLDFRRAAFNSYNEQSPSSSKPGWDNSN